MIGKYNLNNDVILLGTISRKDLPKVMSDANCFVLPSMYETFGVVYIEALACGTPIIATKCGGPEDFFNENLGYMINIDNIDELCNAMRDMINNNTKFNSDYMSKYIKNKFSREVIVKELEKIYNLII